MSKKLITTLALILTLTVCTAGAVFAATGVSTPVLKVNGTTLKPNQEYIFEEGTKINLSATGASKLFYKVGEETTLSVASSTTSFTVPSKYTNTGKLTIHVCAVSSQGKQSEWDTYYVSVEKDTEVSTPVLKVDGTTLKEGFEYIVDEGAKFSLSATGASKVAYKIGAEEQKIISSSTTNFTIPSSYTNTGRLTIYVCAVSSQGKQSEWDTYYVSVEKDTEVSTPVLKVDGTTLLEGKEYIVNEGTKFNLSATGASKLYYKIGNDATEEIFSSTVNFSIPNKYTNTGKLAISVCAVSSDRIQSQWDTYYVSVEKDTKVSTPVLKVDGTTLVEGKEYIVDEGTTFNLSAIGASKVAYKIGVEEQKIFSGSTISFAIPSSYINTGRLTIHVCAVSSDGKQGEWDTYYVSVRENNDSLKNNIVVKVNETTVKEGNTYKVDAGDEVEFYAENARRIYYKFTDKYTQSIVGTEGIDSIPEDYNDEEVITLMVSAILKDGTQTSWSEYRFIVYNEDYIDSDVIVKVGNETLKNTKVYIINEGQEIDLIAKNAKKIIYKVGNSEEVRINTTDTTIVIPSEYTNTGVIKFRVATILEDGTQTSWTTYSLDVRKGINNKKYPLIILNDEKLNSNIKGLNVALRVDTTNNAAITKTGNMNYFLLNEYIQYNIDFVNASKDLTEQVYIDFTIPAGFEVEFVDIKGGKKIDENTIRWTFDGMEKGEMGTIPVTLYYTGYSSNNNMVKPCATIKSGSLKDTSAVLNLIAKNASTQVNTNHEPFMYGDGDKNTFRPSEGMNRAEVASLLVRVLDLKKVKDYTVTYKDVEEFENPSYSWATQDIMTVTKAGLMEGYDDGTFRPGTKVTKAQLITILARAFALEDDSKNSAFEIKDEPIKLFNNLSVVYSSYGYSEHWASKYLAQIIRLNILPEFANTIDGNLDLVISRAEAAKLFCTVLYRGPAIDSTKDEQFTNEFMDVSENTTYYEYILEATADKHNSIYQKNGWEKMSDL